MGPRLGCAVLLIVAAASPASASAAEADRQSVRSQLTTMRPGAATGTLLDVRFFDPANAGGKPHSVDKLIVEAAPGTRIDQFALPRCEASDLDLMARGEMACPQRSRIQEGRIVLDTGSPLGIPRLMHLRTATFNAPGGFVSIGEAEELMFRGVVRSQIRGRTVTVDYADVPGYGGPDGQSAMTRMFSAGPRLTRGRRAFIRTPRRCPRSRRWRTRYTFIYHDGLRQTETTRAPCRPRRGRR